MLEAAVCQQRRLGYERSEQQAQTSNHQGADPAKFRTFQAGSIKTMHFHRSVSSLQKSVAGWLQLAVPRRIRAHPCYHPLPFRRTQGSSPRVSVEWAANSRRDKLRRSGIADVVSRQAASALLLGMALVGRAGDFAVSSRFTRFASPNQESMRVPIVRGEATPPPSDGEPPNEMNADLEWIRQLGGNAASESSANGEVWRVTLDLTAVSDAQLARLSDHVPVIALSLARTGVSDKGASQMKSLARLHTLNLCQTEVSDIAMAAVGEMDALQMLNLQQTKVTDNGLGYLLQGGQLRWLALDRTAVTDAGTVWLAAMPQLQRVSLRGTNVTDEGLLTLGQSRSLEVIEVAGSKVTLDGIMTLRRIRPLLQVVN